MTRQVLAVLVALVLGLRVVLMPQIMAAPEPGLVAICSGGQIVYVSLETGLPVRDGPAADPCPFFSVTGIVDVGEAPMPVPRLSGAAIAHDLARAPVAARALIRAYASRAPPSSV